jgi:thiol:disulfide interchange protein DsbD
MRKMPHVALSKRFAPKQQKKGLKTMKKFAFLLFGLIFLQGPSLAQDTEEYRSDMTRLKLTTNVETISSGTPFKVFLDFDLMEGWHTYADPPGDSGLPVRIAWTLPPAFKAGAIEWPSTETYEDFGFTTYGYSGKVSLPVTIMPPKNTPSGTYMLTAKVDWMVCEKTCIPESAEFSLSLPVDEESNSNE